MPTVNVPAWDSFWLAISVTQKEMMYLQVKGGRERRGKRPGGTGMAFIVTAAGQVSKQTMKCVYCRGGIGTVR